MKFKCKFCGKQIQRKPYEIKKNIHLFCNKKCTDNWQRKYGPKGKNRPDYKSVILKCEYSKCKKEISRSPWELKFYKHHFCNPTCYNNWKREKGIMRGKNSPSYKGKIKSKCDYCGKKIELSPWQVKISKHHFCNRICYGGWRREKGIMRGKNNPQYKGATICPTCGGYKCSAANNCVACWVKLGLGEGENNPNYKEKIKVNCDYCNKIIEVFPCRIKKNKHFFCNRECKSKYFIEHGVLAKENNGSWLGGISFEPYGLEFNGKLKSFIRKRDNYTCQICDKKENGRAHCCHHVDYCKQNNEPENLVTLCNSCHSKTNSNRQYWQNYFEFQQIKYWQNKEKQKELFP